MDFDLAKSVFQSLYSGIDGYTISSRARKQISYATKAHTYGEVTPEGFSKMLTDVSYKPGGIFYDLGSGTGKGVVLASMFGNFSKMKGIEILKELYDTSQSILKMHEEIVRPILPEKKKNQSLNFVNTDFLEFDFSDADFVFSHSTCFYDELMVALERRCITLKKGTKVLLVTKSFQSPYFKLLKSDEYPMTWGNDTVNFYEKV